MIKSLVVALTISILQLSGCAHSLLDNNDVRCPFVERGGCQSMEQVNQRVTEGRYTSDGAFVAASGANDEAH